MSQDSDLIVLRREKRAAYTRKQGSGRNGYGWVEAIQFGSFSEKLPFQERKGLSRGRVSGRGRLEEVFGQTHYR